MNSVEDQVRAATRAQAATLREVRPLRLPRPPQHTGARGPAPVRGPLAAPLAGVAGPGRRRRGGHRARRFTGDSQR